MPDAVLRNDVLVAPWQILLYNAVLLAVLGYFLLRYRRNALACLILVLFYGGIAADFGAAARNVYQIGTLVWAFWLFLRGGRGYYRQGRAGLIVLGIYLAWFLVISLFYHRDNPLLVLAQASKILIPLLVFHTMVTRIDAEPERLGYYRKLFGRILWSVIFFALVKLAILRQPMEGWIGAMTGTTGGGAGTSLPLLGLFWFGLDSGFKFRSWKDVAFVLGLLLVGLAATKRAIWILFPVVFIVLSFFVYARRFSRFVWVLLLMPFFFYAGVRLTPSLNPDNRIWGRFDMDFVSSYVLKYSTGIDRESRAEQEIESGTGRVGAMVWLSEHVSEGGAAAVFGRGNEYVIYAASEDYFNEFYYEGISSRGSITGAVKSFLVCGIVGLLLYLLFLVMMFFRKDSYAVILLLTILFDYAFYNAQIQDCSPMFLLSLFLIFHHDFLQAREAPSEKASPAAGRATFRANPLL